MKMKFLLVAAVIMCAVYADAQVRENAPASTKTKSIIKPRCSPYRSVTGYINFCKELNSVVNCTQQECAGISNIQIKTQLVLINSSNGSPYIFSSTQIITVSEQNDVVNDARLWAAANKPTGYFIASIQFISDIVTSGGVSSAGIDVKVTYKVCTGIKHPNN